MSLISQLQERLFKPQAGISQHFVGTSLGLEMTQQHAEMCQQQGGESAQGSDESEAIRDESARCLDQSATSHSELACHQ